MEAIDRNFISNDLITITFLIGLILVFFMKVYKSEYLLGYTLTFFRQGFIEKRTEDNTFLFSIFYSLLFFFSVTIITITIFILATPLYFENNTTSLFSILITTLIYFISKHSINFILAHLFDIKETVNYMLYTKNGYLYTTCLLLFPILILNQYFIKNTSILLFFIALLLIIRAFLILKNNKNIIFNHMFYFILYFCALELSPLLILYKTIN